MRNEQDLFNFISDPGSSSFPYIYQSNESEIGTNERMTNVSQIWVDSWYVQDPNVNHGVGLHLYNLGMYPYADITQLITSRFNINSNNVITFVDTSIDFSGWSITWGASGVVPWVVPNSFFMGDGIFRALLSSGLNLPYSNRYEQVAFQIWREVTPGGTKGDQFIRRKIQVKPCGNFAMNFGSEGVIAAYSQFPTITFDWRDTLENYLPESVQYHKVKLELINNNTHEVVKTYYVNRADRFSNYTQSGTSVTPIFMKSKTTWRIPESDFNTLPSVSYTLQATPGILYKNAFYAFSGLAKVGSFVKDPTPKASGFAVTPTGNVTVKSMDAMVSYTFNNSGPYGQVNSIRFSLIQTEDPSIVIPVSTISYSSYFPTRQGTITLPFNSMDLTKHYKLSVRLIYNEVEGYYTDVTPVTYISDPQPVQREPTKLKLNNEIYVNIPKYTQSNPYKQSELKLSWSYNNSDQETYGVANAYEVVFINQNTNNVLYTIFVSGLQFNNTGASVTVPISKYSGLIGKVLKLKITPVFYDFVGYPNKTPQRRDGERSLIVSDFIYIDFGMQDIVSILPAIHTATKIVEHYWFAASDNDIVCSKFKIAFKLPKDTNVETGIIDKSTYEYSSLVIKYTGENDTVVTKTYDIGDNSTDLNPTYICVSGDGKLSYENTVIIDLTGIIDPNTNLALKPKQFDSYKAYLIDVYVTNKYGTTTVRESYTIKIVDFPIKQASEVGGFAKDTPITAESMNKFLEARDVVASFTDKPNNVDKVVADQTIKYLDLKSLVDPCNFLYNATKDFTNNVKKYEMPRSLNDVGLFKDDVPYYQKQYDKTPEVYDHIYSVCDDATSVTKVVIRPQNYAKNYNKYFQKPLGDDTYTFRCNNKNLPNDGPITDPYIAMIETQGGHDGIALNYYISIPDKDLYADYTYKINWQTRANHDAEFWYGVSPIIGGSYNIEMDAGLSGKSQRATGIFIGVRYASKEVLATRSCNNAYGGGTTVKVEYEVPDIDPNHDWNDRHTTTFKINETVTPNKRTDGGFFLFQAKNYLTGEACIIEDPDATDFSATTSLLGSYARVYWIEIYDADDNLIMRFEPAIQNNHYGVVDVMDNNKFYPCNDDDQFEVIGYQDLPIYSGTEYNVSWSYYTLYRDLYTDTALE